MSTIKAELRLIGNITNEIPPQAGRPNTVAPLIQVDNTNHRLYITTPERYCRDELLYYGFHPLMNLLKANPSAYLSAKGSDLDFKIRASVTSERVIQATKKVMGPWYGKISPMASPFFLRMIIGLTRRSDLTLTSEKHNRTLEALKRYQDNGGEFTPSFAEAWVPEANWAVMGGFGLSALSMLSRPSRLTSTVYPQSRLSYPENWVRAFPPAAIIEEMINTK